MGRVLGFLLTLCFAASAPKPARAYTPTLTDKGKNVRWTGNPKLNLAGNPGNRSGIGDADFWQAVVRSLQRWKSAAGGSVGFDYWQGTDARVYEANSDYNGLSSVYFASNGGVQLSPNVLGLTQVWYNTSNGNILETDVVLNDIDFRFTTTPSDTSGYGAGTTRFTGGRSNVFIENVLTHELGHALGLSHSGGMQSTMLFMESPEQARLGCDDLVAMRALYPASDRGSRGQISGIVRSEGGSAVFGAHVLAISRRRGTVLATAMTDRSGRYVLDALEPGSYFLMAEPFYAGATSLPMYYQGSSGAICPGGRTFGRSVLMSGTALKPQTIDVGSGGKSAAPDLVARCGHTSGAVIAASTAAVSSASAPVVYDGGSGFGATDLLSSAGGGSYYRLRSLSGNVELHALSYSLYSPVRPTLALLDTAGNPVPGAQVSNQVYVGESGYVNYDSRVMASNLPAGEYLVRVTGSALSANYYPAGPVALDPVPFFVLTGSVNEGAPALMQALPDNARCRQNENFASYQSPSGDPVRSPLQGDGQIGFCGTVKKISGGPGGGGPENGGPGAGAIAGWFLPWAFMLLAARLPRRFGTALARPV